MQRVTLAPVLAGLILFCLTWAFPRGALLSEIAYRTVRLTDLVQRSTAIVVVKEETPFIAHDELPIHFDRFKYPAYTITYSHFQVVEVLYRSPKSVPLHRHDRIVVREANFEQKLSMHREYYLKGVSSSPIFDQYEPTAMLSKAETYIVFLDQDQENRLQWVVEGAREHVEQRSAILKLVHQFTPPKTNAHKTK